MAFKLEYFSLLCQCKNSRVFEKVKSKIDCYYKVVLLVGATLKRAGPQMLHWRGLIDHTESCKSSNLIQIGTSYLILYADKPVVWAQQLGNTSSRTITEVKQR